MVMLWVIMITMGSAATIGISVWEHNQKKRSQKVFFNPLDLQVGKTASIRVLHLRNLSLYLKDIKFIEKGEERITIYRLVGTTVDEVCPYAHQSKVIIHLVATRLHSDDYDLYLALDSQRLDAHGSISFDGKSVQRHFADSSLYLFNGHDESAERTGEITREKVDLTLIEIDAALKPIKIEIAGAPTLFGRVVSRDAVFSGNLNH